MTNITLSIEDDVYQQMKDYSEVKWSEFVRKQIVKRIGELNSLRENNRDESLLTMLASEKVLRKEWDNEADERWNDV
jgi:hypothetical protein